MPFILYRKQEKERMYYFLFMAHWIILVNAKISLMYISIFLSRGGNFTLLFLYVPIRLMHLLCEHQGNIREKKQRNPKSPFWLMCTYQVSSHILPSIV